MRGGADVTNAEKYPNFERMAALLNKLENPRQALEIVVALAKAKASDG